jgi:hypothetical protein
MIVSGFDLNWARGIVLAVKYVVKDVKAVLKRDERVNGMRDYVS